VYKKVETRVKTKKKIKPVGSVKPVQFFFFLLRMRYCSYEHWGVKRNERDPGFRRGPALQLFFHRLHPFILLPRLHSFISQGLYHAHLKSD